MASLLESLTQALNPDIVGQLGKAAGLDTSSATKGLAVVGPLLTGALASSASTPSGLDGLMGMVSQVGGTSTPADLMKMVSGGGGNQILSGLLGPGLNAVTGTLDRALGFKTGPLLAMAAPFVIQQISQRVSGGALDKAGVAKLLQDEHKGVAAKADTTSQLVQQALAAGKEASTTRGRYSTEQWKTLRLGPVAAAGLVIGSSPSGAVGIAKEVVALGDAIAKLKESSSPASLFSLVAAETVTKTELEALPTSTDEMLNLVKRSVDTVSANSPIEGAAYAQFLVDVATKVAEASKEGGFLGIGGTRISDDEQAAIDRIKTAVGSAAGSVT